MSSVACKEWWRCDLIKFPLGASHYYYMYTEFREISECSLLLDIFLYIKKWHIESIYKWWVQLLFFLIHSYRPPTIISLSLMLLAHSSIAWILISIKRRIEKIIVSDFSAASTYSQSLFWPYSIIFELFVWLYLAHHSTVAWCFVSQK